MVLLRLEVKQGQGRRLTGGTPEWGSGDSGGLPGVSVLAVGSDPTTRQIRVGEELGEEVIVLCEEKEGDGELGN